MEEKKTIRVKLNDLLLYGEVSIEDVLNSVRRARVEGATHIHIYTYYDTAGLAIIPFYDRLETDEEANKRVSSGLAEKQNDEKERQEYERLKAKFEK